MAIIGGKADFADYEMTTTAFVDNPLPPRSNPRDRAAEHVAALSRVLREQL